MVVSLGLKFCFVFSREDVLKIIDVSKVLFIVFRYLMEKYMSSS